MFVKYWLQYPCPQEMTVITCIKSVLMLLNGTSTDQAIDPAFGALFTPKFMSLVQVGTSPDYTYNVKLWHNNPFIYFL